MANEDGDIHSRLHFGQNYEILAKMKVTMKNAGFPDADKVEAIPATEMKNAHGKRLPAILKKNGVARVTRYNQTDYFVLSPEMFESLVKKAKTPGRAQLLKLKTQYRDLLKRIRSPQNQKAFAALSKASSDDLGASVKVGSTD